MLLLQLRTKDTHRFYHRRSLAAMARGLQRHLSQVHSARCQAAYDQGADEAEIAAIPRHDILAAGSAAFTAFRRNLDGAMKRSTKAGLGGTTKAPSLHPRDLQKINDSLAKLPPSCMKVKFQQCYSNCWPYCTLW